MFTEERALWLYQNYRWLEQHLPAHEGDYHGVLILPTPKYYPQRNTRDHAFAESILETTKAHMGMTAWKCRLVPQSDAERDAAAAFSRGAASMEMRYSSAAGTFSAGEDVEIT